MFASAAAVGLNQLMPGHG